MTEKKKSIHLVKHIFLYLGVVGVGISGVFALAYIALPALMSVSYTQSAGAATATSSAQGQGVSTKPLVMHMTTPEAVKAIYLSQCVAGTPSFRDSLIKLIDETELNAVVIDIRDYTGKISFPTDNPALSDAVSKSCGAPDMQAFVELLHKKGIYVIGRITTFQNPYWTSIHPEHAVQKKSGGVWKDYKGLAFVDVGAKPYWSNVVELAKESYALGFDELNFDYIRFPSDGPMSEADYTYDVGKTKEQALEEFYQYLSAELKSTGAVLSADLFGFVSSNKGDLGIGQVLERALPYFDYISPMVYPSHYPSGFNGYKNVNDHPYDVVKYEMDYAVARTVASTTTIGTLAEVPIMREVIVPAGLDSAGSLRATTTTLVPTGEYKKAVYSAHKIRPWLQSFDYPVAYTPAMVEAQIKATADAGLDSWIFWDAANKYTSLRKVLLSAQAQGSMQTDAVSAAP